MASSAEQRLSELGIELPPAPTPAAAYVPWRRAGDLLLTAGQLPVVNGALHSPGKVGTDLDLTTAQAEARQAAINVLAVAREANQGSLDGIELVKLTVFVASAPEFTDQHLVANGASELLADVLGDRGAHARSAVGVAALPRNGPVEVEAIFRVHEP